MYKLKDMLRLLFKPATILGALTLAGFIFLSSNAFSRDGQGPYSPDKEAIYRLVAEASPVVENGTSKYPLQAPSLSCRESEISGVRAGDRVDVSKWFWYGFGFSFLTGGCAAPLVPFFAITETPGHPTAPEGVHEQCFHSGFKDQVRRSSTRTAVWGGVAGTATCGAVWLGINFAALSSAGGCTY